MKMKNYYLVKMGKVTKVDPCKDDYYDKLEELGAEEDNGNEWVIAYAYNPEEALKVADLWDQGKIEMKNIWCQPCGTAHAAAEMPE